jgi:hypothetical protein
MEVGSSPKRLYLSYNYEKGYSSTLKIEIAGSSETWCMSTKYHIIRPTLKWRQKAPSKHWLLSTRTKIGEFCYLED